MPFGSMVYTMGTALNRASDLSIPVRLLVGGEWIGGLVLGVDGHGVVLGDQGVTHSVVKVSDISAVQILSEAPMETSPATAGHELPTSDVPASRQASAF